MPLDPHSFIDLASELLETRLSSNREAVRRTAVGRIYYGTFLQLRRYLRQAGIRAPTFGAVYGALIARGDGDTAGRLAQLHALRNQADYDETNDFTDEDVIRAIRLADLIADGMTGRW